ncbi:hypothetical protein [Paraburkholderia guartelaensis]|uniref:hypothetical protein n=1 Tax=Paraburkholderia guartelaensis TaxID=2546446 RepID=UPI002AB70583|nr:hypothetical protein [Paraburkholderia guartelaensis]
MHRKMIRGACGVGLALAVSACGKWQSVKDGTVAATHPVFETKVRRKGGRFEGNHQRGGDDSLDGDGDDGTGQSSLYTLNGRGANQSGDWIRLRGRVYAAYRDSAYGVDDVYLIRPLTVVGEVPVSSLAAGTVYGLLIVYAQRTTVR